MRLDATTLGELFRLEGPALLLFAARRTYDAELALDVVGEAFAVAFEKRASFRGGTRDEALGWLYAILRTVISHHFRRADAERRALSRLGVDVPHMEDEERHRIEQLAGLTTLHTSAAEALQTLPLDQRDAVELRVVDELPYPLIAERLTITQDTARARVSRGLRSIAAHLQTTEPTTDAH